MKKISLLSVISIFLCGYISLAKTWREFSEEFKQAYLKGDVAKLETLKNENQPGFANLNDLGEVFFKYGPTLKEWNHLIADARNNSDEFLAIVLQKSLDRLPVSIIEEDINKFPGDIRDVFRAYKWDWSNYIRTKENDNEFFREPDWSKISLQATRDQFVLLRDLSRAKTQAKNILFNYTPSDAMYKDLSDKNKYIIKTSNPINRLVTRNAIEKTIVNNNFSRTSVPKKYLMIKNQSGRLSRADILSLVNDHLTFHVLGLEPLTIGLEMILPEEYTVFVYSQYIKPLRKKFEKDTCLELIELAFKAPFDAANDNIFSDVDGKAIIIDTEYKGESSIQSAQKIYERYCKPDAEVKEYLLKKISSSGL